MRVEVSNGELVDKYTILLIKDKKITDSEKNKNIKNELNELFPLIHSFNLDKNLINDLFEINKTLWKIEDDIRNKEYKQEFDSEFIELARSVYKTNDLRFKAKQKINESTASYLKEEKSH
jgi:hypothetical protein